ncbi:MAG: DUF4340 domain-containing protein [Tyzzerella sp.]|nr:DUF4340 domain-containing protein [Tyzzerella sp.]
MKKRKNTMLTLLIILVVLLLCYFVIGKIQENQKDNEPAEETVYAVEVDDIVSMTYSDGSSTMAFTKADDTWTYDADATIALEQSTIESMASTFGTIAAERVIEEPDALADYGLEEPAYTIELQDSDGNVTAIYVGNQVDSYYYATVGDKEVVYTVSSSVVSAMKFDVEELKEVEEETEDALETDETTEDLENE